MTQGQTDPVAQGNTAQPAPESRASKARELIERANQSLDDLAEALGSADTTRALKTWLAFAAKFHRYSLRNQMLIYSQRPTATAVPGFHTWRKLGRWVKKGEKGIAIIAPVAGKRTERDEASGEESSRTWMNFRAVYVFAADQTEGDALWGHSRDAARRASARTFRPQKLPSQAYAGDTGLKRRDFTSATSGGRRDLGSAAARLLPGRVLALPPLPPDPPSVMSGGETATMLALTVRRCEADLA